MNFAIFRMLFSNEFHNLRDMKISRNISRAGTRAVHFHDAVRALCFTMY